MNTNVETDNKPPLAAVIAGSGFSAYASLNIAVGIEAIIGVRLSYSSFDVVRVGPRYGVLKDCDVVCVGPRPDLRAMPTFYQPRRC